MAEKTSKPSSGSISSIWPNKPVPMKFFGAWEVDKTPANCIPRLCTLTITKLVLLKQLGPDVSTIIVAVKMQSSKRTLRSNEITISGSSPESPSSSIEVELDLTFALQYPHFLKRGGNQLHILLQRRKRYKNHAILGFKTLAAGVINMSEVLQRSNCMKKELDLKGNIKDIGVNEVVARIVMSTLKSQPVDQEGLSRRHRKVALDRSTEADSEDDVEDFTSNEEGSDSEAVEDTPGVRSASNVPSARKRLKQWRRHVNSRKARKPFNRNISDSLENGNVQQRNLKQKFVALLKKFRIPDSEAFESEEQYQEALEQEFMNASSRNDNDIDDFLEEEDIEDLSDSGQESDDISISSTPKPRLRPFFSTCTLVPEGEGDVNGVQRRESESQEASGTEQTPYNSDSSLKQQAVDDLQKKGSHDKKSKLFSRSSSVVAGAKEKEKDKEKDKEKEKKKEKDEDKKHTGASSFKDRSMSSSVDDSPRKSVLDHFGRIFSNSKP